MRCPDGNCHGRMRAIENLDNRSVKNENLPVLICDICFKVFVDVSQAHDAEGGELVFSEKITAGLVNYCKENGRDLSRIVRGLPVIEDLRPDNFLRN